MKLRNLLTYFVVIFGLFSNTAYCAAESIRAPIGKWETAVKDSSGAIIKVEMEIKADHTFHGLAYKDGIPYWTYGGRWSLDNNEFTSIYTESSQPLPENYRDTDILISVGENEYTYKSTINSKVNTYHRMK